MNRIKVWFLAARPRTLPAGVSPVILGGTLAWKDGGFRISIAVACLVVAIFAQIASNFANDYFDFIKGADGEGRLGPRRAVASGWITPEDMLAGTIIALVLAFAAGIYIASQTTWLLLILGIAIAVFVLAYSSGPFPLAYNGLGDICVLLFYGIVPVSFTHYVLTGEFTFAPFILGVALGFAAINILVVNNYRDYEEDKSNNKRTTVVFFGKDFALYFYLFNGILAVGIAILFFFSLKWFLLLYIAYFALFFHTWNELRAKEGRALNAVLGHTARNVLILALLLSVSAIIT